MHLHVLTASQSSKVRPQHSVAEVGCQSLHGKTDIDVQPVEIVTDFK